MPAVAIVIVTYNRIDTLRETLERLLMHIRYSDEIYWIVADDGSNDGTQDMIRERFPLAELVQTNRGGLGANTNAGVRAALERADFILQLQDDLYLMKDLDLTPFVERLKTHPEDGVITLWNVAWHGFTATEDEGFWRIHWDSRGHYIFNDHPHLKHRRAHDYFGMYPEGLRSDYTEETWCGNTKATAMKEGNAPNVLIPIDWDIQRGFDHVGHHQSWRYVGL